MRHLSVISQSKIPQRGTDRSAFTEKRNGFVTEKEERIETENYLGSLITTRHPYYVTYYYDNNGNKLMGWQDINGERYYFKRARTSWFRNH